MTKTPPTPAEVMSTLDEMAAAALTGQATRYRAALRTARDREVTDEQMRDAYRWGRLQLGAAELDWQGA